MKKIFPYLIIFAFTASLFLWLGASPNLGDGDSFYHAKITDLIIQQKAPVKNFPWLPFTTLQNHYTDHHFLFHLYLIPFVLWLKNSLVAIKFGTVLLAALFFLLLYWILRKLNIKHALVFSLLPLTTYVVPFRLALAKAPAASLIAFILGIFALLKNKMWLLFLISFLYVWLHGGWPAILMAAIAYTLAGGIKNLIEGPEKWQQKINQNKPKPYKIAKTIIWTIIYLIKHCFSWSNLKPSLVCLVGVFAGLIINPYFPQNIQFYWVQIFKVAVVNYQTKIGVGAEWLPYDPISIFRDNLLLTIFWLLSSCWFILNYKTINQININPKERHNKLFLFIFSILFFLYTLKARRMGEYFFPLVTISIAIILNTELQNLNWKNFWLQIKNLVWNKNFWIINIIMLSILASALTIFINAHVQLYVRMREFLQNKAPKFNSFQNLSYFIKKNAPAKTIVFHSEWTYFPMLFYYNDQNYYISGLDSTFFYDQNPELYILWRDITRGEITDQLAQTIQTKFQSSLIIIDKNHAKFDEVLKKDKNFTLIYQDQEGNKLYQIVNAANQP